MHLVRWCWYSILVFFKCHVCCTSDSSWVWSEECFATPAATPNSGVWRTLLHHCSKMSHLKYLVSVWYSTKQLVVHHKLLWQSSKFIIFIRRTRMNHFSTFSGTVMCSRCWKNILVQYTKQCCFRFYGKLVNNLVLCRLFTAHSLYMIFASLSFKPSFVYENINVLTDQRPL